MRIISLTSLSLTAILLWSGLALASPQTDANELVKNNYADIKKMVAVAKDRDELAQKITGALDALIGWHSFSSKTLSKSTWKDLSATQKTAFIDAYRKLIVRRYAKRFKPGADFRVEFRKSDADDDQVTWVRTTVHSVGAKKKLGVDVDYEFQPGKKGYRVADIVTDGVSRSRSYRPKFKRILKKRGFDALIEAIERNAKKR